MVLNRISKVLVTIAHGQNLALLEQTHEDILILRSHTPEDAGLVQLQPCPVSANLSPLVVARIEQNSLDGFDVLRELAFLSEQVLLAMKFGTQQHFGKVWFL
jgi:hypothetical protein